MKKSANGRYLVDQNNLPFLIVGDSPQSLIANLSLADAGTYLADRSRLGFNTVLVDVLVYPYTGGNSNGSLLNGTLPFTGTISTGEYDLTTPNEAYFEWVDSIVNLAAEQGICVMLDPCETGGWLQTMLDNGPASCRAYGQYLGNRYKNFPNIIWSSGNDFDTWSTPSNDAVATAVALGIKNFDTNHIHTIELNLEYSSSLDDPNWAQIVSLNAAYTYFPTYAEVLHAYNQSTTTPAFMIEAHYEYEDIVGDTGTPEVLRRQEYWTLLSGGTGGQLYGNHYTWQFLTGWQSYLDSPGAIQMGYLEALFEPLEWYNLVPDQTQSVVTAGYGTFSASGPPSGNNYVTAASTPDGSLVMAYLPTLSTITVNMATLSGRATARWYDPSDGVFTAISGSPFANSGSAVFTPPGTNSAGDGDWVLLLQYTPPDTTPPSVPAGLTATATSSSQISLSWTASTDSTGVTGYLIERSQGAGSTAFAQIGTATGTTYSDTGLSPSTVYNYKISATDSAGNLSGYSITVSATTEAAANGFTPGLVAAYSFSEGTGTTTADSSGNGIAGTIEGATWTTAGKYGDALSFNGSTSNVSLGNPAPLQLTGSMTLEAWIYATATPSDDGDIIAKSESSPLGWQLKTTPDTGARTFGIGVSNAGSITQRYSKTVVALDTWYHVAGVYNAAAQTLDIYVNGVLDDGVLAGTVPAAQINPALDVLIGKREDGFAFAGTIDEVRVYSQTLTQAQIQSDMNTPITGAPVGGVPAPEITSALTATGTTGSSFTYNITASNLPTSFSATNLPTGLSVNTESGVIAGTPTAIGTTNLSISATNAGGTGSAILVLTIQPAAPVITSASSASAAVGSAFSYSITASNSPTSFQATGLPAGLSVNTSTGSISGTPTAAGTSSVTISATNAGGSGSASLTLTVHSSSSPAPVVNSATSASAIVGSAFSYSITATNFPTSYNASGLPTGLSVNTASGLITGTPTAAGTSTVTISASNAGGTGSASLSLTVRTASSTPIAVKNAWLGASGSTSNATVPVSPAAGNLIVVAVSGYYGNYANHTVTDNKGSVYTRVAGSNVSTTGLTGSLWYLANAPAGLSSIIGSSGSTSRATTVIVHEVAGASAFTSGEAAATTASGTTNPRTPSITNGTANSIFFALCANSSGANPALISINGAGTIGTWNLFSSAASQETNGATYIAASVPNLIVTSSQAKVQGWTTGSDAYGENNVLIIAAFHATQTIPVITSASTATATVGSAFSYSITGSNSPTSYGAAGLPAGLSLNTASGIISGTPTAAGTSTVTISARNASGTGSATLTLTVASPSSSSISIKNAWLGASGSDTATAAVSPISGSLIVVAVSGFYGSYANHTVTDNVGSVYIRVAGANISSTGLNGSLWYLANAPAGITSIVGSSGSTSQATTVIIHDVAGASAFTTGQAAATTASGTTNPRTGSITNGTPNSIFFALCANSSSSNPALISINGAGTIGTWNLFSSAASQETNGAAHIAACVPYSIVSSSQAEEQGWTTGPDDNGEANVLIIAAFH